MNSDETIVKVIFVGPKKGYKQQVRTWLSDSELDYTTITEMGRRVVLGVPQKELGELEKRLGESQPSELYYAIFPPETEGHISRYIEGRGYQSEAKRLQDAKSRALLLNALPSEMDFER